MSSSFLEDLAALWAARNPNKDSVHWTRLRWMLMTNGEAEPDDNIIIFGFDDRSAKPALVVKVPRSPQNKWMLQTEYDRLTDAWICLGRERAVSRLPEPLAMFDVKGQPALVLSYLDGKSWLRTSQKKFWRDARQVRDLFTDAAHSLRELNEYTAIALKSGEASKLSFIPKIEKFRQINVLTDNESQALTDLIDQLAVRASTATHKVLLQGDFWHGNTIRGSVYGKLMLLDWQYSRWSTDISLDVYMFLLAGALATVPRRSDRERAKALIDVLFRWQSDLVPAYLAAYGQPTGFSLLPIHYGLLMCCIEKSVRSVMDFGYNQYGDSFWVALFSELVKLEYGNEFHENIE